jgi:DNA-binding response OmpR family regulator
MIINILVFGTYNFNKTLDEIKNKLSFNLVMYDSEDYLKKTNQNYHILFVNNEFLLKQNEVDLIELERFNLPILLLIDSQSSIKRNFLFDDQVYLPINILDLKKKVNDLLSSFKFSKNSSINIKNYTIDKNLKTMSKDDISINLTEKEVNLLVLLNEEKKPLNKKLILKKIWQYSTDVDTHTVETHIYRLRKKVLDKFGDKEFINIFKDGYSL